jgi:succinylarginine dihydrolase
MRLCISHQAPGIEIFVYGRPGGQFPARQHEQASRITARKHGLDPERVLFVEQNQEAIAAGAFHNDVVAVANEHVLFSHELAFANPQGTYDAIRAKMPEAEIVVVPDSAVSLAEAIRTYLFNAQLVTLPSGEMSLIIPTEAWDSTAVRAWLDVMLAGNGPIRHAVPVDVKQSMANGGGPACLRLRVVAEPETIDPRFLLDEATADVLAGVIESTWLEQIDLVDLGSETLERSVLDARSTLLQALDLQELT